MLDSMQKGGPLMWPLLLCSILAGAVFFERVTYFHRATIRVGEFMRALASLIQQGRFDDALHEAAGTPGPVARVIQAVILRHEAPCGELKEIAQEASQLEVPRLKRRLGVLATIALTAPLLGLFGTIAGLIAALVNHPPPSGSTPVDLASIICQRLFTTVAGLIVAIPSTVGYAYLHARVNALRYDMERAGLEIVNLL